MNLNISLKVNIRFFLAVLFLLIVQISYSKTNFPTKTATQHIQKLTNETIVKTKHSKFKKFKKFQQKKEHPRLFGALAVLAFILSIIALAAFPFSIVGPLLSALFFVASCMLAYLGTSKDKIKRLAKLSLIINLVIALSIMISILVLAIISL